MGNNSVNPQQEQRHQVIQKEIATGGNYFEDRTEDRDKGDTTREKKKEPLNPKK